MDPSADDYSLQLGSAALDKGTIVYLPYCCGAPDLGSQERCVGCGGGPPPEREMFMAVAPVPGAAGVRFNLNGQGVAKLFDVAGRLLRREHVRGRGSFTWTGLRPGIYFVELAAENMRLRRSAVVLP
jgi:hypothetical protein